MKEDEETTEEEPTEEPPEAPIITPSQFAHTVSEFYLTMQKCLGEENQYIAMSLSQTFLIQLLSPQRPAYPPRVTEEKDGTDNGAPDSDPDSDPDEDGGSEKAVE